MDQPTYEELEVFNQRLGSQLAKALTAMTEWQHRALTAERNLHKESFERTRRFHQTASQLAKALTAMTEWQHRALTAERNLEAMKEAAKAAK